MRRVFEVCCVALAVAILFTIHTDPPPPSSAYWIGVWLAISAAVSAIWSMWRAHEKTHERAIREADARVVSKQAAARRRVRLTPQALTAVNRQRRITGRPALSPAGFYRATVTAPADKRLESQNDWLLYYLLWDVHGSTNAHSYSQTRDHIPNALEIEPGGGAFGGAGASGTWTVENLTDVIAPYSRSGADLTDPKASGAVDAIAAGAAVVGGMRASDWSEDPRPFAPTSDATPTRSEDSPRDTAPPTPSYEPPNSTSNTESSPNYSAPESSPSSNASSNDSAPAGGSGGGDGGGAGGGE